MQCKECNKSIIYVDDVSFDHIQGELHVAERRARMVKAHKCGYHLNCFEDVFDPFKRCLLTIKAERK